MSNSDFLDDERRRLAYADRAETREGQHAGLSVEGLSEEQEERLEAIERRIRGGAECGKPTCCFGCGCPSRLADGTGRHSRKEMEGATNGYSVSFTSVPQLCAAYEYALETLRRMYAITDRKQHAFQSEQDVMADARALLLAAGKDVE